MNAAIIAAFEERGFTYEHPGYLNLSLAPELDVVVGDEGDPGFSVTVMYDGRDLASVVVETSEAAYGAALAFKEAITPRTLLAMAACEELIRGGNHERGTNDSMQWVIDHARQAIGLDPIPEDV